MLEEAWVKFRGIDKWPVTQAKVRFVEQYEEPPTQNRYARFPLAKAADITFAYSDGSPDGKYGSITVSETSSLYDAKENDLFPIRFNPKRPEQYYSTESELAQRAVSRILPIVASVVAVVAAIVIAILARRC